MRQRWNDPETGEMLPAPKAVPFRGRVALVILYGHTPSIVEDIDYLMTEYPCIEEVRTTLYHERELDVGKLLDATNRRGTVFVEASGLSSLIIYRQH